jgi:hypothetical protein
VRPVRHHEDCLYLTHPGNRCTCVDLEDEMIEDFQVETPYRRSPSVPQSTPQGPYQSLASLIRAARRAGHLRPIQQYGGGHAPAFLP